MGIQSGANDFLTKPVDVQDLLLRVRNAVTGKRQFDQLQLEREKSENLLLNILPKGIAARMRHGETSIADHYPDVSVLVADLVGFTELCTIIEPGQVVSLLAEIFSVFDEIVDKHGLEESKRSGTRTWPSAAFPILARTTLRRQPPQRWK